MTAISLKNSTALVTGGAGFVGSHVVDALVQEGARVKVLDNLLRGGEENLAWAKAHGRVDFMSGDIREQSLWDQTLEGVDVVFHQAALRVNRCEENPTECWEIMVEATRHLLEACVRHQVKKVVLASSAIVYGAAETLPTPESHHLNHNNTWYGTAKIINEQLLQTLHASKKLSGVALRYFNIYGTRVATKGHTEVLIKWFQALDAGQPIRIFGDGQQTMDWVDVRDVARANVLAAASSADTGVFNVGTGQETTLLDFGRTVLRLWGKGGEPELVTTQAPTNAIPRRWASITAAESTLGYQPQWMLEKGLADMVKWWKNQPKP